MTLTAARRAVVVETYADYAVEAYNLRKVYRTRRGRRAAVDGLDLRVPLGGVHGFLGPNGSGKTTTIRMLLGLITADSGYIRVFDHEVPLHLDRVIDRVGAIVEQPKFFPSFSGRKNLALLATAIGVAPPPGRPGAGRCRAGRPGRGQVPHLLPGHEAAPGDRRDPAQGPQPADLRRADQRTRPGRYPRDPGDDAQPRRPGQDGPGLQPHPERGPAGRRHRVDHRPRPDAGRGPGVATSSPRPGSSTPGSASTSRAGRPDCSRRPVSWSSSPGGSCTSG